MRRLEPRAEVWNTHSVKEFLQHPTSIPSGPLGRWIQQCGGLARVRQYLRELQLGERQKRLLDAHLDHPDASVDAYCSASGLAKSAFHNQRNALAEMLSNHLNAWHIDDPKVLDEQALIYGNPPAAPELVIGRDQDLEGLKRVIGIAPLGSASSVMQALTILWGWPGVGKTTLAAVLAHDHDVRVAFPDGVLWLSVGQNPNIFAKLSIWARPLGVDAANAQTVDELKGLLRARLRGKRMLLVIDDVWEARDVFNFRLGECHCAMLITTRVQEVVFHLEPVPHNARIYPLSVLNGDRGVEILSRLAPTVVATYPDKCRELVGALEGLPLALRVAGLLLNAEAKIGLDMFGLLRDLINGVKIIDAPVPPELGALMEEVPSTVAALLQRSISYLPPQTQACFARLGALAPEPATFALDAMRDVWELADPIPMVRELIGRGLLEPVGEQRFHMHAVLHKLANSLLRE
jgi:hypothetical protein